jgi:hypothetical protein
LPGCGVVARRVLRVGWGVEILVEPLIGLGLLFARTRLLAVGLGLFFHALIYWTMPVGTFSATMWLFYLAFFPPDEWMALLARWSGEAAPGQATRSQEAPAAG